MREKLYRFMQGRNGNDDLNGFLMIVFFVVFIISMFTRGAHLGPYLLGYIANWLAILVLFYAYFRMFSRNLHQRAVENQRFLQWKRSVKGFFTRKENLRQQKKTYRIYTCPKCKQKIRIPKGKGKVEVRCPKCGATFVKRS